MPGLATYYTPFQVKQILLESEGRGPGTGGHAYSLHGPGRDDVTDRDKAQDGAFQKSLAMPGGAGATEPIDMAFVVAEGLNSSAGQSKLATLDAHGKNAQFSVPVRMGRLLPKLRVKDGDAETEGQNGSIFMHLFNWNGALHIHTAYMVGKVRGPSKRPPTEYRLP